jgi:hypothetical protein
LQTMLTGDRPREQFEKYDREIADALARLLGKFAVAPDSWNSLESTDYGDVASIDQAVFDRARGNLSLLIVSFIYRFSVLLP